MHAFAKTPKIIPLKPIITPVITFHSSNQTCCRDRDERLTAIGIYASCRKRCAFKWLECCLVDTAATSLLVSEADCYSSGENAVGSSDIQTVHANRARY